MRGRHYLLGHIIRRWPVQGVAAEVRAEPFQTELTATKVLTVSMLESPAGRYKPTGGNICNCAALSPSRSIKSMRTADRSVSNVPLTVVRHTMFVLGVLKRTLRQSEYLISLAKRRPQPLEERLRLASPLLDLSPVVRGYF